MEHVPGSQATIFEVRTDASALRDGAVGPITGPLFLEIGGDAFPQVGWRDFPVVVLAWWIRAVLALQRAGVTALCRFMDGPFEFELERASPDVWELRLLERHVAAVQVVRSGLVAPEEVLLALSAAADLMLQGCKERNWSSRDVDELRRREMLFVSSHCWRS